MVLLGPNEGFVRYTTTRSLCFQLFAFSIFCIALQSLTISDNQALREASSYVLWEIQDNQRSHIDPPPSYQETTETDERYQSGGHVMISYQWDSQKRAIFIRDRLVQEGYKVWMDVDNMRKY